MTEFIRRSRKERLNEEQVTKQTVALGVVTLLVFGLIMIFGLPVLIRFSIFLGDLKSRQERVVEDKVIPPPAPRLSIAYEATNSASISVTGASEPGLLVELLKDDVNFDKVSATETGEFKFDSVNLDKGENIFTAIAVSEKGAKSDPSRAVPIVYDDMAPGLDLTNPVETELKVDYADFDLVGATEKGASVLVNNRVAMVDDNGGFKMKIQLSPGKNEFEVKARDLAGNETKKNIVITYDI
ncbi:MAG: hypothetical protein WCT01_03515 [Candidatus Shapirobacteria bacterium]